MSIIHEGITRHITKIRNYIDLPKMRKFWEDLNKNFVSDDFRNIDFNAICINRKPGDVNSITGGNVRGLYWTMPCEGEEEVERLPKIDEQAYTEICPEFKDTYVEEFYNKLSEDFKVGRVRFLMKPPRSCLSYHRDPEKRIHIPIITSPGCRMVIEDISTYLPADGSAYITDNTKYHNFFNGSEIDRVHIVATLLEE